MKQQGSANNINELYMFGGEDSGFSTGDGEFRSRIKFSLVEDLDLEISDKVNCSFCGECEEVCLNAGAAGFVRVKHKPGQFHFTVEGTGVMPPEQIVELAFEVLLEKLKVIADKFVSIPMTAAALGLSAAATSQGGLLDLH